MKLQLCRELLALNEGLDHLIGGLERMEKAPTYRSEMIRWAKAHVESAQVEANRQFFDQFDEIVENDAIDAYKSLRDHTKRITGDLKIDIVGAKHREETRKAKGLPPRLSPDEGGREQSMTKRKASVKFPPRQIVPGRQCPGVHGDVVDWVDHDFEEGILYIRVRFADKSELCWRIGTSTMIEEADLSDWKTDDFRQLKVFTQSESDGE